VYNDKYIKSMSNICLMLISTRKGVLFEPGDWVWVYIRNERFLECRRSNLMLKGDDPFQILERINDNAYKMDLPDKYDVSATFNYFFFFFVWCKWWFEVDSF